jgi:hypothetical protein
VAKDLRMHLGDNIRVSAGKLRVFLYADTAAAATQARVVAREVLAQHQVSADCRVEYWDLSGEAWRDAAADLPGDTAADPQAAREYHADQQRQQRQRSVADRLAGWQVRVDLPTHDDIRALADRLTSEGWPVVRRRKFLVAGADCEDDANGLAQEIQGYISPAATISVQPRPSGVDPSLYYLTPQG